MELSVTNCSLVLSGVLFLTGMFGVLVRRNIIVIFMSIELMLSAANVALIAFANQFSQAEAHVFVLFVIVIAAVEAAVGLSILIALFRLRSTVDAEDLVTMKW